MKNARLLMLFALGVYSLFSLPAARAANHLISMYFYNPGGGSYYYSPATISVPQGDSVTWSNADFYYPFPYYHSTTSGGGGHPDELWNSGSLSNGLTFTLNTTTLNPGSYPYFCTVDYSLYNMSGTLTVTAAVKPPPPLVTSSKMLPSGSFMMALSGTSGQSYTVEGSSNLLNWTPLFTNLAPANSFNATDLTSPGVLQRYYRVR